MPNQTFYANTDPEINQGVTGLGFKLDLSYVTGFWKTDRTVTLDLFRLIDPANGYTCTLHIHSAIIKLG